MRDYICDLNAGTTGRAANPALRCSTIGTFVNLPWGFKIFYGMLSDAVPIMGQHRKPYLVLGWSATLIGALAFTALPTVSRPLIASTCHCSRPRVTRVHVSPTR